MYFPLHYPFLNNILDIIQYIFTQNNNFRQGYQVKGVLFLPVKFCRAWCYHHKRLPLFIQLHIYCKTPKVASEEVADESDSE